MVLKNIKRKQHQGVTTLRLQNAEEKQQILKGAENQSTLLVKEEDNHSVLTNRSHTRRQKDNTLNRENNCKQKCTVPCQTKLYMQKDRKDHF